MLGSSMRAVAWDFFVTNQAHDIYIWINKTSENINNLYLYLIFKESVVRMLPEYGTMVYVSFQVFAARVSENL